MACPSHSVLGVKLALRITAANIGFQPTPEFPKTLFPLECCPFSVSRRVPGWPWAQPVLRTRTGLGGMRGTRAALPLPGAGHALNDAELPLSLFLQLSCPLCPRDVPTPRWSEAGAEGASCLQCCVTFSQAASQRPLSIPYPTHQWYKETF